jgi:hypothetical protein
LSRRRARGQPKSHLIDNKLFCFSRILAADQPHALIFAKGLLPITHMKVVGLIASALLVLIGLLHISMTAQNYQSGSAEALWFIGSGMLLIASGIYSFTAIRTCERDALIGAGLVSIGGVILSIIALNSIDGSHTYILLTLYALCLITNIYRLFPRQS